MSRRALVFGASGQIGRPLLARLLGAGWEVDAVSRQPQAARDGLRWWRGDLARCEGLPGAADAIFSCGPLDAFARWYAHGGVRAERVVAFGSTSMHVKRDSGDPSERDVAARLHAGERQLFAAASARGATVAVLRPTLVYGGGADRTLTRIAALARRWGRFVLPRGATGLRQPVHVDDLAEAAFAASAAGAQGGFDLPGAEALPYREMVARVLATLEPPPRLVEVPAPLFALLLAGARVAGLRGLGDAAVARMREDLVFDAAPARVAFGYAPRAFRPGAGLFG